MARRTNYAALLSQPTPIHCLYVLIQLSNVMSPKQYTSTRYKTNKYIVLCSRLLQTKQSADGCITFYPTRYIHVTDKPRPRPPPQEPIDTGYGGGGGQQQSKQPPSQPQPPKKSGPGNSCKFRGHVAYMHRTEVIYCVPLLCLVIVGGGG